MNSFELEQRVNAFYGKTPNPGTVVGIYDFIANNSLAKVYMVEMDDGNFDTFAANFMKAITE